MLDALLRRNLDLEFGERFAADDAARWADRFRELYVDLGVPGTDLLPGAGGRRGGARRSAGACVVVTAKYEPNARRCLAHVGLVVDAVFGWRYADGKGDTLLDEGAAIYVGDTPNDVRAAARAGAHMVAVTTGPHPAAELRDAGATTVLDSLVRVPARGCGDASASSAATTATATAGPRAATTTASTTSTERDDHEQDHAGVSSTDVDASIGRRLPARRR